MALHGKWTKEAFDAHHKDNSDIYEMFKRFAFQAAARRDHFSAKAIFHRIRWETQIVENNADYKIDDGWISHYARKFMEDYPEHTGFFETRTRRDSYHRETRRPVLTQANQEKLL